MSVGRGPRSLLYTLGVTHSSHMVIRDLRASGFRRRTGRIEM